MPKNQTIKNSQFNLINKEVKLKRNLNGETSWYSSLSILFLIVITSLGVVTYMFGMYMDKTESDKKQQLVDSANNTVNILSKNEIKSKINTLNDKFSIYNDINGQNFDVNTFYNNFKETFPLAQVNTFNVRPDATYIEVSIVYTTNGYDEFPKFLDSMNSSTKFANSVIKSVVFSSSQSSTADVSVQLIFDIPKS